MRSLKIYPDVLWICTKNLIGNNLKFESVFDNLRTIWWHYLCVSRFSGVMLYKASDMSRGCVWVDRFRERYQLSLKTNICSSLLIKQLITLGRYSILIWNNGIITEWNLEESKKSFILRRNYCFPILGIAFNQGLFKIITG